MFKQFRQLLALQARVLSRPRQALLLPVQTLVTARHLLPLARLAREEGVAVCYALSPKIRCARARALIRHWLDPLAEEVSCNRAHAQRWALIVVADHGHFHTLCPGGSPIAHIGHGSPSKLGGRIPHLPWEYGQAPRRRNGEIAYCEMIEASEAIRDAIAQAEPALAPRIRVLGRLLDDEMLGSARDRAAGRASLGLDPGRPVLLVASTLGPRSLFATCWDALQAQLPSLAGDYQIVLAPHPNEYGRWHARHADGSGLRLLEPERAAEEVIAVADALLTDFSSLCHKAALLDVPLVFMRCEPLPVWPQGATARLYAAWPKWDPSEPLAPALAEAGARCNDPATLASRAWINSRPGQAQAAYRAWLRERLPGLAAAPDPAPREAVPGA